MGQSLSSYCESGDVAALKSALAQYENKPDELAGELNKHHGTISYTALHFACVNGCDGIVKELVAQDGEVYKRGKVQVRGKLSFCSSLCSLRQEKKLGVTNKINRICNWVNLFHGVNEHTVPTGNTRLHDRLSARAISQPQAGCQLLVNMVILVVGVVQAHCLSRGLVKTLTTVLIKN